MASRWIRYDVEVCTGRTNLIRTMLPIVFLKVPHKMIDDVRAKIPFCGFGDSGESIAGTASRVTLFTSNHFLLTLS